MSNPNTLPVKRLGPVRISLLILLAVAIGLVSSSGFYTDFLWFNQLGFTSVFTTKL